MSSSHQEIRMRRSRMNYLCIAAALIGMLLIGAARAVSIAHTAWAAEGDADLSRLLAVRLASLTSPDPDPRRPASSLRVWAMALDRTLAEYLPATPADNQLLVDATWSAVHGAVTVDACLPMLQSQ